MPLRLRHLLPQSQRIRPLPHLPIQLPAELHRGARPRPRYLRNNPAVQDFSIGFLSANHFAVYPSSVGAASVAFQFDFTAALWTRVRVNFWASTHSQLQLGYFKVGTAPPMQTTSKSSARAIAPSPTRRSPPPSPPRIPPSSASSLMASTSPPMRCRFRFRLPTCRALG